MSRANERGQINEMVKREAKRRAVGNPVEECREDTWRRERGHTVLGLHGMSDRQQPMSMLGLAGTIDSSIFLT